MTHDPDSNPNAPLTKADADTLLRQVESLLRGGVIATPPAVVIERKSAIKESRQPERNQEIDPLGSELSRALGDVPMHKIQRKERNLAPRVTYSLRPVQTTQMLRALQSLTPAAAAIIVYLATHPRATVPDLVMQLDLRRKTVQNLLSILSQRELIQTDPLR